jgi:AbrB family looped-hinge helix DNA binding protein
MLATLTSKGQVTLPKEIRERLGLTASSQLDFSIDDNGELRARRAGNHGAGPGRPAAAAGAAAGDGRADERSCRADGGRTESARSAMIGIDTNILVRLLTYDDPAQAEAASSRVTLFSISSTR